MNEDEEPRVFTRHFAERQDMQIHDLLRLIISQGRNQGDDARFPNNNELVRHLKVDNVIQCQKVERAMLECPRDIFVPHPHRGQAFFDSPIRVDELEFNVSAPHIHASFLEKLQAQPGELVLDVGCGCGIVTAYLSMLAGPTGRVVGIDIKDTIIELCTANLTMWRNTNPEAARRAAPIALQLQNVFLPSAFPHQGKYDRVHVGAGCPASKLPDLISLLKPEGGVIVAPIESEMRVITKQPSGQVQQSVVSGVRFSELMIPTDAEIVLAHHDLNAHRNDKVAVPPSTFPQDIVTIERTFTASSSLVGADLSGAGASPPSVEWGLSSAGGSQRMSQDGGVGGVVGERSSQESDGSETMMYVGSVSADGKVSPYMEGTAWGITDCYIQGRNFSLPAHRAVLRTRCEHFRARFDSGMRDASTEVLNAPDHFAEGPMVSFLSYVYKDKVTLGLEDAAQVLHIAAFYGVPRLQLVCEQVLATELKQLEKEEEEAEEGAEGCRPATAMGVELAGQLLRLCDAEALHNLRAATIAWIARNLDEVKKNEEVFGSLTKDHLGDILLEVHHQKKVLTSRLEDLSHSQ